MPNNDGIYTAPQNWDDFTDGFDENGDCADWIEAIRAAMLERYSVAATRVNSSISANIIQTMANNNPYFNGLNTPELYDFARKTEFLLDRLLTIYEKYQSDESPPSHEQGIFLDPTEPVHTITYRITPSDPDSETTTLFYNFLDHDKVFEDDECNYKLALEGVCKGSPPCDFVDFFKAAKKTLNLLHVVPVNLWGFKQYGIATQVWGNSYSSATKNASDKYDEQLEAVGNQTINKNEQLMGPNGTRILCQRWVRARCQDITTFYIDYRLECLQVHRVAEKFPSFNMALYVGTYWTSILTLYYPHTNRTYEGPEDEGTVTSYGLGTCRGEKHTLDDWVMVGENSWEQPAKAPEPPDLSDPDYIDSELIECQFVGLPYVDFAVEGGFKFRDSE